MISKHVASKHLYELKRWREKSSPPPPQHEPETLNEYFCFRIKLDVHTEACGGGHLPTVSVSMATGCSLSAAWNQQHKSIHPSINLSIHPSNHPSNSSSIFIFSLWSIWSLFKFSMKVPNVNVATKVSMSLLLIFPLEFHHFVIKVGAKTERHHMSASRHLQSFCGENISVKKKNAAPPPSWSSSCVFVKAAGL